MNTAQAPTPLGVAKIHGHLVLLYIRTRPHPYQSGVVYDVCLSVDGRESLLLDSAVDIEFADKVYMTYSDQLDQIVNTILAKGGTQ